MRSRVRDNLVSVFRAGTYKHEYWDPYRSDWITDVSTSNDGFDLQGTYASISYGTCKKDRAGFRPTMPCDHLVATSRQAYASGKAFDTSDMNTRIQFRSCYQVTDRQALLTTPSLPDLAVHHNAAMDYFKSGCVDAEVQLPVSLLEAGEVKSLVPQFHQTLSSLRGQYGASLKEVKRLAKGLAGGYLAVLFGILPIISDIKGVYRGLTQLEKHISWLRKNQGKPVRVSYRATIPYSGVANTTVDGTNAGFETKVLTQKAFYHAFAIVTYDVSSLTDIELRLRALTRRFGFDDPFGTFLEMIPFSFLLGWIVNVGDLLNSLTPKITLPCIFKDLGYSVKIVQEWEHQWVHRPSINGASAPGGVVQHCTRTFYTRRRGLPLSFGGVDFSIPSNGQLWTGLALLMQKL